MISYFSLLFQFTPMLMTPSFITYFNIKKINAVWALTSDFSHIFSLTICFQYPKNSDLSFAYLTYFKELQHDPLNIFGVPFLITLADRIITSPFKKSFKRLGVLSTWGNSFHHYSFYLCTWASCSGHYISEKVSPILHSLIRWNLRLCFVNSTVQINFFLSRSSRQTFTSFYVEYCYCNMNCCFLKL